MTGFVAVLSSVAVAQQFHEVTAEVGLVPEAKTSWGNPIWGDIKIKVAIPIATIVPIDLAASLHFGSVLSIPNE
jgi:hypothetical protein